jgi:hypothetical protein
MESWFIIQINVFLKRISALKILIPTFLGILDIFSDIYYVLTEFIVDDDLKNLMIFFIIFPIIMQLLIWTTFFSIKTKNNRYD